jgi:glycosyltransferase involved in cell wall biosynthesis
VPQVSVVVPVYNPGVALRACIDSLLAQSLPAGALELIFVDDGSTDGSGELLDGLAASHPQLTVIHQENSGWAGKPRNVGLAAATGVFVQFVDQDDALGPEALERLSRYGTDNAADIVIGKVTSDFRRVPHDLFRANLPRCSLRDAPLIRSLTPHKMFRRQFLIDTGLRYAEGRRRLEDQLFMVQAYLATDAIAVLADYPCYYYLRRADAGNAGMNEPDPVGYYRNLREVIDVVVAGTDPGGFRDRLLERFLNAVVKRLRGIAASSRADAGYLPFEREIRRIVLERFPPQVLDRQPTLGRQLITALLTSGSEQIREVARLTDKLVPRVAITDISPAGEGWDVSVTAELALADGSPIALYPADDGWRADERLAVVGVDNRPDGARELLSRASGDLLVRDRRTGVEWLAADRFGSTLEPIDGADGARRLVVGGTVRLDPDRVSAGGRLDPGTWVVAVRFAALGLTRTVTLRVGPNEPRDPPPGTAKASLRYGQSGRLQLAVAAD